MLETTEVFVENSDSCGSASPRGSCSQHQDGKFELDEVSAVCLADPDPHVVVGGECGVNEQR